MHFPGGALSSDVVEQLRAIAPLCFLEYLILVAMLLTEDNVYELFIVSQQMPSCLRLCLL